MESRGKRLVALALAPRSAQARDQASTQTTHMEAAASTLEDPPQQLTDQNDTESSDYDSDVSLWDAAGENPSSSDEDVRPTRRRQTSHEALDDTVQPASLPNAELGGEIENIDNLSTNQESGETAAQLPVENINDDPSVVTHTANESWESTARRNKSNPTKWKKNIRKQCKAQGKAYTSCKGIAVPPKVRKHVDCTKCRFKCCSKFSNESLDKKFREYWETGNYERQRDFIVSHVEQCEAKWSSTIHSRKKNSFKYFLGEDGVRKLVCKKFFLATLNFSQKTVQVAMKKKLGAFVQSDQRGKHPPANKTSAEDMQFICDHIRSFPRSGPHYVRKDSRRHYLGQDLNLRKMYMLYKEKCHTSGRNPVKEKMYRNVFCTKFNLGFHRPKKDQCAKCTKYNLLNGEEKEAFRAEYDAHIANKDMAEKEKVKDKADAKENNSHTSATFDLQSVLYVPCSQVSTLYYLRKLCMYNMTVYNQATQDGNCYTWTEVDGKRGSTEIGTCILKYIENLPDSVKRLTIYSDSCGGQNKNRYLASAMWYGVQKYPLETVELKFLEPGHTYMECDSMHAAIEYAKKSVSVYSPREWINIIIMARKQKPYAVTQLQSKDFYDLKKFSKEVLPTALFLDGRRSEPLQISKVKCLRAQKKYPFTLEIKASYSDPSYVPVRQAIDARRPKEIPSPNTVHLSPCYARRHPVSKAKKDDLLSLCRTGGIPSEYHEFFKSLPVSARLRDCAPMPTNSESEHDSD